MTERFGSRKTMRLEHRQDALAASRSCCPERRANFGGMVSVIIDEQKAIAAVFDFKPTPGMLELAKASRNFFKRNPKLVCQRDHADRIVHVMPSGNIQHRFAQLLAAKINAEYGRKIAQLDIGAAIIGVFGKAVRDYGFSLRAQSRGVRIIGVVKNRSGGLLDELNKDFFDRGKIDIKIKMFLFDIQNQSELGMKAT